MTLRRFLGLTGFALVCLAPFAASAQSVNIGPRRRRHRRQHRPPAADHCAADGPIAGAGILIMVTSFTRVVVVLSLLRAALGGQQTPPNMVMVSLAMFLTAFVMAPTFTQAYNDGIAPLMAEQIDEQTGLHPLGRGRSSVFMLSQVREKDLGLFMDMAGAEPAASPEEVSLQILIPAS
jgi:hypothetical protein